MAPYHPSSNGQAERAVQTFKKGLQRLKSGTIEERLDRFLSAYRLTPHATTGQSPAEMLLGRRLLDLLHPDIARRVQYRQIKQSTQRGHSTKLRVGESVYARNFRGGPTWLPATILERTGPVSYVVQLDDGRSIRRHVDHLRLRLSERRTTEDTTLIDGPSGVGGNSGQVHSRSSAKAESARPGVTSSANEEIEVDAEPGQRQVSSRTQLAGTASIQPHPSHQTDYIETWWGEVSCTVP